MKKTIFSLLFASIILCSGGLSRDSSASPAGRVFEISISHHTGEDNSWHRACVFFKEYVEERSGGRIKVKIYPNDQFGSEVETIHSILTGGGADMTLTGESMQSVVPEMGVLAVPYLITSSEELNRVVNGAVGEKLEKLLADKANMTVLGYFERGARNITANRPIRKTRDMEGLRIRITASKITMAAMNALGASPMPMPLSEVQNALRRGVVEAQENPLAMIKTMKFYEAQKFLCKTEHLRSWVYIVISESKLNAMPEDLRSLVIEAGREMQRVEHEMFVRDEEDLESFLEDAGMTVVDDVDRKAFADTTLSAIETALPPEVRRLYDLIKSGKY
ncbi:MAG: TRAP transporter substrate-binding protein [Synergistaceae bacterium]|jgi:tripartite ATP-independent transporter DctP family solute receptor|nr:TRAP transporter substrate-binding protein [Synergistaceae bacterium]